MPLHQFDPPANQNDLSQDLTTAWSEQIAAWIQEERTNLPENYSNIFFNELEHPEAEHGDIAAITWEGFPRFWKLKFPNDEQERWAASEKIYQTQDGTPFRYQDEYLEWLSFRENNKLKKIIFTCEGPEYWEFIAQHDEQLLLNLYRQHVSPAVQLSDLFINNGQDRQYNRSNKWNITQGIMHLTQPNNTLRAEVNLAARAAILRKNDITDPVTDTHDLICCSGFGAPERFSDPTIGAAVNSLVRQGLSVTLNNPVGLYIGKLKTAGIEVPQGFQVSDFWKIIRGDRQKQMILRAEFSAPEGSGIDLNEVLVGGQPLQFGAQLAEMIDMVIYGKAFQLQNHTPDSQPCGNFCEQAAGLKEILLPADKAVQFAQEHNKIGLRMLPFQFK